MRQDPRGRFKETYDREVGRARGLLRHPALAGAIKHSRKCPPADLSNHIAHYWSVRWDLPPGATYVAETMPNPNLHLIFERGRCLLSGAHTRKFSRVLRGRSEVFGVKFQPGAFRPFIKAPVSKLTDHVVPAQRFLGSAVEQLNLQVIACRSDRQRIAACNAFFRDRLPERDQTAGLAKTLVERILGDTSICSVNDLAAVTHMTTRSLQRIFKNYVGTSPKRMIRAYRLHELVERLQSCERLNWAQLAVDLGYFDQAHLINDFRSAVGCSPNSYRNEISRTPLRAYASHPSRCY
jgi:AraC-like DNA-binding protein